MKHDDHSGQHQPAVNRETEPQLKFYRPLYATAPTADKSTGELERHCENWRKHLTLISKGQAGLGVRMDQEPSYNHRGT